MHLTFPDEFIVLSCNGQYDACSVCDTPEKLQHARAARTNGARLRALLPADDRSWPKACDPWRRCGEAACGVAMFGTACSMLWATPHQLRRGPVQGQGQG